MPVFTKEESWLIQHLAIHESGARRWSYYLAALVAPVGIVVYGIVQRDYVAVSVGFFGLLIMVLRAIWDQEKRAATFRSVGQKLLASGLVKEERHDA